MCPCPWGSARVAVFRFRCRPHSLVPVLVPGQHPPLLYQHCACACVPRVYLAAGAVGTVAAAVVSHQLRLGCSWVLVLSCPGLPLLHLRCACACVPHIYPAAAVGAVAAAAGEGGGTLIAFEAAVTFYCLCKIINMPPTAYIMCLRRGFFTAQAHRALAKPCIV